LFGHARGAFTGADSEGKGLLQMADGGTVFLDEVGELPTALQAKLLGVLERRKVTPIGTSVAKSIDVRVIAATNRNLAREVNEGRFRSDLFFRLAVVRLRLPPQLPAPAAPPSDQSARAQAPRVACPRRSRTFSAPSDSRRCAGLARAAWARCTKCSIASAARAWRSSFCATAAARRSCAS